jgi:hypothetical protein
LGRHVIKNNTFTTVPKVAGILVEKKCKIKKNIKKNKKKKYNVIFGHSN